MATLGHGRLVSMMFDDVDLDVTCCSASAATNTVSGGSTSQVYNRHIAATNNGHEADVRKQAMAAAAAKPSVHRQASSAKNCIAILPVSSPWTERVVHDICQSERMAVHDRQWHNVPLNVCTARSRDSTVRPSQVYIAAGMPWHRAKPH